MLFNAATYVRRSLVHFRVLHASVAAGVAVASAVIVGALIVGDSVRGSLRDLALGGLEQIDAIVLAERPFGESLPARWREALTSDAPRARLAPLVVTRGSATRRDGDQTRRASGLALYGITPEFWSLRRGGQGTGGGDASAPASLKDDEVVLSAAAAAELGAAVGDDVVISMPTPSEVPAETVLGEKEEVTAARRAEVVAILDPQRGDPFARFGLQPNQRAPQLAFLSAAAMQQLLETPGRYNALAIGRPAEDTGGPLATADLQNAFAQLRPSLADYQAALHPQSLPGPTDTVCLQLDSERLLLPSPLVEAARDAVGDAAPIQESTVYLANRIVHGERQVPYSTVVGIESLAELGPLMDASGQPLELRDDEVVLNDWIAGPEQLDASVGDVIELHYYEPESSHGQLQEAPPAALRVKAIVPLHDEQGRLTRAADQALTPELPGVTDADTINSWDLPFELTEEIRDADETYWEEYRTVPKAFVTPALAQRLWGTRWGDVTVVRLPLPDSQASPEEAAEALSAKIAGQLDPQSLGIQLQLVRSQATTAATGTTPFEGLFLGFSFFLLASAVMLAALLFQLGVEQRTREAGILLAAGATPRRVQALFGAEGFIVALAGATAGAALGWTYAKLMIYGLNHWWVEATSAPFLTLHLRPASLAIGVVSGLAVCLLAIGLTLRRLARLPVRQLLAGDAQRPPAIVARRRQWTAASPPLLLLGAIGLAAAAWQWQGEAQAGAFLGSGAMVLVGALMFIGRSLRRDEQPPVRRWSLPRLAAASARRNPLRTLLSLGLASSASFLIVGLGAFRMAPSETGTGGYDLLAESDVPLHADLDSPQGRNQLGFGARDEQLFDGLRVTSCRVQDGEDASCLNLYQTSQPRVLGVPPEIAADSRFAWGAHRELTAHEAAASPWDLLQIELPDDPSGKPVVPMVVDQNTAMYSLKLYRPGDRLEIRDARQQPVLLEVVGLLKGSVLQGSLMIGEQSFRLLFPESAGRRFFLINAATDSTRRQEIQQRFEQQLEDYGFDVVDARVRLAELLAVQNTYLSTFQSLGGLGLLLGAVGLGVAQLRSVLERRSELALLRAVGFRRQRLAQLVLWENAVILLGGLLLGSAAAAVAVLPQAVANDAAAPWQTLGVLVLATATAGLLSGWLAVRAAVRTPVTIALRE